jgi:surface polysaccharide O-acyltransferase-like enzyme
MLSTITNYIPQYKHAPSTIEEKVSKNDNINRDNRSDILKAVAIIGVVCIHSGFPNAEMFGYCVPVFIGVWAYHYEKGLERRADAWLYAGQRFTRLLLPYAFWTVLYLCLNYSVERWTTTPIHTILGGWFGGYGWAGQYFFIILFQLTLIFPVVRRWVREDLLIPIAIVGLLFNVFADYVLFKNVIISQLSHRPFIYWIPYMLIGIALARGLPTKAWLLGFVLSLFAAPYEMAYFLKTNLGASGYLLASVSLGAASILLSVGPRRTSRAPKTTSWFVDGVIYVGRNSMPIFLSNPLFIELFRKFIVPVGSEPGKFLLTLTVVVGAISGGLILNGILRRLGLGAVVGG